MRTVRSPSLARIAAGLCATALAAGCSHVPPPDQAYGDRKPDPRDLCRISFRACAPPASYASDTDVRRLPIRSLVQIAVRLDIDDDLAERAGNRLKKLVPMAEPAELLEAEAAMEDVEVWSGRCRCDLFRSELEKQGIGPLVAGRLPPKEARSPERWVGEVMKRIDASRAQKRRAAELAGVGSASSEEAASLARAAERDLCQTVHDARGPLSPEAFRTMLDRVYEKVRTTAGDGSAEVAKRMLDEYQATEACEVRPAEEPP